MAKVTCNQCGRQFKSNLALRIHLGKSHAGKALAAKAPAAKAPAEKAEKAAPAGGNTCSVCGRSFALAMHLGRHMKMSHGAGAAKRPVGRPRKAKGRVGRPRKQQAAPTETAISQAVAELSVDQLLQVKAAVDARLDTITKLLRQVSL